MFTIRKTAALVFTTMLAGSTLMSASGVSTSKNLSSNFTLVNLVSGQNNGQIQYVKPDGTTWKATDSFTLDDLGSQAIYRQYEQTLDPGSGSVVVSTDGPVGAVVQIQARSTPGNEQVPTSGAYIGVSEGAASANVPLVSRRGSSLSGKTNSQIIIQNASSQQIDVKVDLINSADGTVTTSKTFSDLNPNASVEYDLDDEAALPEGWFGSATVTSLTAGGEVAVVSNFFTGPNAMQTFNAFTTSGTTWFVPLFTSRLSNSLSTPIAVQNVSGADIAPGGISIKCTRDPNSPDTTATIEKSNTATVKNTQAVFFNPAPEDSGYPATWYGSCIVTSSAPTVSFVQMRFVSGDRAGAYEAIPAAGNNTRVVIPLYAKRLANSFASAVTIQNKNTTTAANVTLHYKGAAGSDASCTKDFTGVTIPAGGSYIQNHRIADGANSVPTIADGCVGTLTVDGDQPLDAFVQLDFTALGGDAFMAHTAFTVAGN